MRDDAVGLFWQDIEIEKNKRTADRVREMPPIPDTGWKPSREFPRLDSATAIGVDTETFDPDLIEHGPGWGRGNGHVVGVSIATHDASWYFPVRHTVQSELNLDPVVVFRWLNNVLSNASQPKAFANAIYDLGWLHHEGVSVAGPILDVQIAEPLLDEFGHYSLESLSQKYLKQGKVDDALYTWLAAAYGGNPTRRDQGKNIHRSPVTLCGPYAEADARLALQVWDQQRPLLEQQSLMPLYELEAKLPRLLMHMRLRGVRVDLEKAQRVDDDLTRRIDGIMKGELKGINVNAAADLERYAASLGITPPRTEKGNPSFSGKWLEHHMPRIGYLRRLLKVRDTFVRGYIMQHHVNGRLHCSFNQLRGDEYGTVSGRFSSSSPNLQNIPARDEELGPLIRGLFVPDEGHPKWRRFDWSQIEYRLLTHYAVGRGAEQARALYREKPDTDFHVMASDITGLARKPAKNMNFGMVYGMAEDTMAETMGRPVDEVRPMLATYHEKFPFVKATYNKASRVAKTRRTIVTLKGRIARFDRPDVGAHKALNRLLQGSAADIMKVAMVQIWESGVCGVVGPPPLTVHDELDCSDAGTPEHEQAFREIKHIMETCVTLRVPLLAAMETGPDWGHTE